MTDAGNDRARWTEYLNRMMGERTQAEYARLLGVTDGQLSKWRNGTAGVKVERVVAIARKLGDSPLHALVELGYLVPEDVARFKVPRAYGLDDFTDLELAQEVVHRIEAGEAGVELTGPAEVIQFPSNVGDPAEDQAAARETGDDNGEDRT